MNLAALAVGIVAALFVIQRFKTRRFEGTRWAYPALLATFPVYYWTFAIYASDYAALRSEMAAGAGFLLVAYIAWRVRSFAALLLLALGYATHAAYDVWHDSLFLNPGTPAWWPEFCGSVDLLLGAYIAWLAMSLRREAVQRSL